MPDIHVLRVKLLYQKKIYRDIAISANAKLHKLAHEITKAFGFHFDHAFGFYSEVSENYGDSEIRYELFVDMEDVERDADALSVKKTALSKVFHSKKQKMLFVFDYGDEWLFEVEVLDMKAPQDKIKYPYVVKSSGTAPPQYSDYEEENMPVDVPGEILSPGTAKKADMINKLMQIMSNPEKLSAKELQEQTKNFFAVEFENSLPEIDRLEQEEEKNAKPENANQTKLQKYFEANQAPDEAMLELWMQEKWISDEANFPLLRHYCRHGNSQLEKLILFGLNITPNFEELIQDLMDIYEYKPKKADKNALILALVAACDVEADKALFEDFFDMLCQTLDGPLPAALYDQMDEKYKSDTKKHKWFRKLAEKK